MKKIILMATLMFITVLFTGSVMAQEQWEKEQADNYMKNRNDYTRAYGACLEGKGYTVK